MSNRVSTLDPCIYIAHQMSTAREVLSKSKSPKELVSAAREYEDLQETLTELHLIDSACLDLIEDVSLSIDFRRTLYGRIRT
jgi:hypothetical protein